MAAAENTESPVPVQRFYKSPNDAQRYMTEAQLVLIGILQGVALGVLADGSLRDTIVPPDGEALGATERWLDLTYIFITFLVIAVVTYLYLMQILLFRWPMPPQHVLFLAALAAGEFLMVVTPDRPGVWFFATAGVAFVAWIVHWLNWLELKNWREPELDFSDFSDPKARRRIRWQYQVMPSYQRPFLVTYFLTGLVAVTAGFVWVHFEADWVRWAAVVPAGIALLVLAGIGACYYHDHYGAICDKEPEYFRRIFKYYSRIFKYWEWV